LGAAGAAVVGLFAMGYVAQGMLAERAAVRAACDALAQLAGAWVFATEVTGARSEDQVGIQGYYELEVDYDAETCSASARVTKTGFTGRYFSERRMQHASAPLRAGEGASVFGYGAKFELRDHWGRGPDQEFIFSADRDRLVGTWRQRGERWEKSGLYGFLDGRREADPRKIRPRIDDQPCLVRCAVVSDAALDEEAPSGEELELCQSECSEDAS
jgi:hypothetical protein